MYQKERLPTLDFECWVEGGVIKHSYFQKPMKTPYLIMARSAMAYQSKMQILANELTRRLSNIQEGTINIQEILNIIEQFTQEMKNSGYNILQAREAVLSGIRGWKGKQRKRKRAGQEFYRLAQRN